MHTPRQHTEDGSEDGSQKVGSKKLNRIRRFFPTATAAVLFSMAPTVGNTTDNATSTTTANMAATKTQKDPNTLKELLLREPTENIIWVQNPKTGKAVTLKIPQILSLDKNSPTPIAKTGFVGIIDGKPNGYNTTYRIWEINTSGIPETEWVVNKLSYHIPTGLARQIQKDETDLVGLEKLLKQAKNPQLRGTLEKDIPRLRAKIINTGRRLVKIFYGWQNEQYIDYSPYHPLLNTPENRKLGLAYLNTLCVQAKTELLTPEKYPHFSSDFRKIIESIRPSEIAGIILNEKVDDGFFRQRSVALLERERLVQEEVDKALIVLQLNKNRAYMHQGSDVGAKGIAQIMPRSFEEFKEKYTLTGEHADWIGDHKKAIQFSFLHVADDKKTLQRKREMNPTFNKMFEGSGAIPETAVFSMSYNAGIKRVTDILEEWYRKHAPSGKGQKKATATQISYNDFMTRQLPETGYYSMKIAIILPYLTRLNRSL